MIPHVVLVERGVGRLRYHDHPLPPPQTVQMNKALPPRASAYVLQQVALVGAVEAVSAKRLILVVIIDLLHVRARNRDGRHRARTLSPPRES